MYHSIKVPSYFSNFVFDLYEKRRSHFYQVGFQNFDVLREAEHNWLWRVWNYGKKIRSFLYKNLLFHRGKQDPKWSSGVPYCSLLLIWWKDRKLSKKNNEIVSLRSNPQDKEHFCLPNTKTGLKPCGFASMKVVRQKSITSLFWCLEYFIS